MDIHIIYIQLALESTFGQAGKNIADFFLLFFVAIVLRQALNV